MQILLCAATPFEIAPAAAWLQQSSKPYRVVITGVGLMAATYSLTKAVLQQKPHFILQAGIAGTFDEALPLAKTVVVGSETIGDAGVKEGGIFRSLFDMGLTVANEIPWQQGRLVNPVQHLGSSTLAVVNGVTVNEITTDPQTISYYKNTLEAQVESMEGAALHYVALHEGIRFLQMRSLSNYVGVRDKTQWQIKPAIESLNAELIRLLSKL